MVRQIGEGAHVGNAHIEQMPRVVRLLSKAGQARSPICVRFISPPATKTGAGRLNDGRFECSDISGPSPRADCQHRRRRAGALHLARALPDRMAEILLVEPAEALGRVAYATKGNKGAAPRAVFFRLGSIRLTAGPSPKG